MNYEKISRQLARIIKEQQETIEMLLGENKKLTKDYREHTTELVGLLRLPSPRVVAQRKDALRRARYAPVPGDLEEAGENLDQERRPKGWELPSRQGD